MMIAEWKVASQFPSELDHGYSNQWSITDDSVFAILLHIFDTLSCFSTDLQIEK